MSQTRKHSRLQSILAYYILWKLRHQPQLIQKIVRPYLGSGLSKHDNAFHTETYLTTTSMGGPYVDESGDTMTGTLGVPASGILFDSAILLKRSGDYVQVRNSTDTGYKSWETYHHIVRGNFTNYGKLVFASGSQSRFAASTDFNLWNTAAYIPGMTFVANVANPYIDIPLGGDITVIADKCLAFTESTYVTIDAVGNITIQGNNTEVETNGGAASDNLDTINGGTDGQIIVLRAHNDAHTVVCRNGVGNLNLNAAGDFSLDSDCDTIILQYDSGAGLWLELARSDNA